MTTTASTSEPTVDGDRLRAFDFRAVGEIAVTLNSALVVMGDRLGYYRVLAGAGPTTPAGLDERTGTDAHYIREWLGAQAAGGFVDYDPGWLSSRRPGTGSRTISIRSGASSTVSPPSSAPPLRSHNR